MARSKINVPIPSSTTSKQPVTGPSPATIGLSAQAKPPSKSLEGRLLEIEQLLAAQNLKLKQLEQHQQLNTISTSSPLPPSHQPKAKVKATRATTDLHNSFSRRRLFKQMGLVTVGLATLAAAPLVSELPQAQVASGEGLLTGNSNFASDATYLSQTAAAVPAAGTIAHFDWNAVSTSAPPTSDIALQSGTAKFALAATSANGVGAYFKGVNAPIHLAPGSTTGAPTTEQHNKGELYVDSSGNLFICKANGTPGTWSAVGSGGSGNYVTLQSSLPGTPDSGNATISGSLETGAYLRARGDASVPYNTGGGLELTYSASTNGGEAGIRAYDRSNSVFKSLAIGASQTTIYGGWVSITNGMSVSGYLSKG